MKNKILLLIFSLLLLTQQQIFSQIKLSSYPAATATIYLDFDGEIVNTVLWNNGVPFTAAAPGLTDNQITEIFNRVSEDYRPFNVNVTTDLNVFLAAPLAKRIRVIVTPTSAWYPGVGGIGYVGSFTWGDDTPCFVFSDRLGPNNTKKVAECCSHESGHTLGLSHQSTYDSSCNLKAVYNVGVGSGEIAWAPIMGNSYYRNMSGWNDGPTPYGCSNVQDNISIIVSQNGFSYRTDDYSDDIHLSPTVINAKAVNVQGIISTSIDKDAFTFSLLQNANLHLDARPFSVGINNDGADLDIKLMLYDSTKNLIGTFNPADSMSATIDTTLYAGVYYLVISGTGNSNVNDYSSLGSYTITGFAQDLPVCNVQLTGLLQNDLHELSWTMTCYQNLKSIDMQTSADGTNFNDISTIGFKQQQYTTTAYQPTDVYYRLKVTSSAGVEEFSNTVLLKKLGLPAVGFKVSTFVTENITVNSLENFQYHLMDLNGNRIKAGSGIAGANSINMFGKVPGMYILRLSGSHGSQTEKIIKQ